MTDNEIIKALECCKNIGWCVVCPLYTTDENRCTTTMLEATLDLIQRQQARIMHPETLLDDRCDKCIEREREDAVHSYREDLVEQLEKASCYIEDGDGHAGHVVFTDKAIAIVKGAQHDR